VNRTLPHSPRNRWLLISLCIALAWLIFGFDSSVAAKQTPQPTPTLDRLATPVMPSSPQPADYGRQVYYLNCMPCHGDVGQGLTDEWRDVWEEDHRDCWASGCHGGRAGDEGFPVPRTIPAVIGAPPILGNFQTSAELLQYLKLTHPPQRPGVLSDIDYKNVTALLWEASGRFDPEPTLSPTKPVPATPTPMPTAGSAAAELSPTAPSFLWPLVVGLALLTGVILVAIARRGRSAT
jgi:mono/diheme cytochrome c family protein